MIMEGFSFHLNGYDVAPRASLASDLVDRCALARAQGLVANSISIGGGFAVSYLDAPVWHRFNKDYQDSWFHGDKKFTHFYPYHKAPTGAGMLREILASPVPTGHSHLAAQLAQSGIRLLVEPGRALLDGSGFTAFPVQRIQRAG